MVPSTLRVRGDSAGDILGVVTDRQAYKNLCYLLLALPLGFIYGMPLLFGFTFGLFFSVLLIGIPILLATVFGTRLAAGLERIVANALLEVDLESPDDVRSPPDGGLLATIRAYLDAASTWRGLGFVLLKFWIWFVSILLLIALATILSVLTAPLHYPYEAELITVNDEPITWTIGTLPEAFLALGVGAILAVVFVHLSNGFAYVAGRMAVALLDGSSSAGDAAAEAGSTDDPPSVGSVGSRIAEPTAARLGDSRANGTEEPADAGTDEPMETDEPVDGSASPEPEAYVSDRSN
ncbi:histidine kinase [Natronorubrum sp. JWXQ-INN-674]|uniref:Histidine kinase n=1 Tax=Natronorubrum halalkaliphilum TaxID=2691917 RepID=A0A6B0VLY3_9EURY|nr:sensor domain-containing protein [Natronorubrum halalkaliphilum]MXV62590.1 histidine kinase [Natronorubrum halalkaliphilum]